MSIRFLVSTIRLEAVHNKITSSAVNIVSRNDCLGHVLDVKRLKRWWCMYIVHNLTYFSIVQCCHKRSVSVTCVPAEAQKSSVFFLCGTPFSVSLNTFRQVADGDCASVFGLSTFWGSWKNQHPYKIQKICQVHWNQPLRFYEIAIWLCVSKWHCEKAGDIMRALECHLVDIDWIDGWMLSPCEWSAP